MRVSSVIARVVPLLLVGSVSAFAQRSSRDRVRSSRDPARVQDDFLDKCRDDGYRNRDDRVRFCEVREKRIAAPRMLDIDGQQNGGVSIHGWDQDEVLILSKIQSEGNDADEARDLASGITVETSGGRIRAEGPSTRRQQNWSVSYEIWAPRQTDIHASTHNGGVSAEDLDARLELSAVNGGINLQRVSGDVRGETTNGPLNVTLDGDQWRGAGLDLRTTNGPVNLEIPDGYSARLETGTVNGGMRIDFPVTLQGTIGRRITTQLGRGGAPIRALTTNGPVEIHRR